MKIKKLALGEIGFVLFLFCFIFAPPLIPKINLIFFVFIYAVFQLLRRKKTLVTNVFYYSGIQKFCTLMFIAYVYIIFIMSIGILFEDVGSINYIKTLYRFILLIPITVTCIVYLIVRIHELKYDVYDVLHAIIKAGMIQVILSILMFLIPSVKEFIVNIMFANTGDNLTQNLWVYQRRLYGFSNSLLDSFGYGTGVIAALPLILAARSKIRYLLYIPFLLIVPFLNSRTGLIIFIVGLICCIPLYAKKLKLSSMFKLSILTLLNILFLSVGYKILKIINPITSEWIGNGLLSVVSMFNTNNEYNSNIGYTESTNKLFSAEFWYVPDSIWGFLFGTGHNVYEAIGFTHSDVGYINDLWLGGVLGLVLFYCPLLSLFIGILIKEKQLGIKYLVCFLGLAFLVTNIKGYMINYNVGMAVTLAICFSIVYLNNKNNIPLIKKE
ncbi:MAG: hypothetical protein ABS951_03675 [Solibacillus sp.]